MKEIQEEIQEAIQQVIEADAPKPYDKQYNKQYHKQYNIDHKERIAAKRKERHINILRNEPVLLRKRTMLNSARKRAKALGLPFSISIEDIRIPDLCPITGVKLWSGGRGTSGSLDRIVPELGYVKNNIGVISLAANQLKGGMSISDIEKLFIYVKGLN